MAVLATRTAGKFAGYTLGGIGIIFVIGTILVGALLLSLIPLYTPDSSANGYGEIYVIPGLAIKAIFTNVSLNFTGGSVLNLQGLSDICTTIFRAKNIPGFYACVATGFTAYGPSGDLNPNTVQRREVNDASMYEVGNLSILFSNTCANKRAYNKWYLSIPPRDNSSCVARRAALCRTFITTPNSGGLSNQWSPFPSTYTQLVSTNVTGTTCGAISISSMYNIAYFNYASVYTRFNLSRTATDPGDCFYSSAVPQSYLQYLTNNQANANGTNNTCAFTYG